MTSLFTNVPIDIAVNCVNEQWNFISKDCFLPKNEFLGAIRFVLDSTFFSFDNVIYKQSFGTPMGSPLSSVIADSDEEIADGVLDVVEFGHFVLLQIR